MTGPANPLSSSFYSQAVMPARSFHSQAGRGKQISPVIGRPADQRKQKETADIISRQRQVGRLIDVIGLQPALYVTPEVKVELRNSSAGMT